MLGAEITGPSSRTDGFSVTSTRPVLVRVWLTYKRLRTCNRMFYNEHCILLCSSTQYILLRTVPYQTDDSQDVPYPPYHLPTGRSIFPSALNHHPQYQYVLLWVAVGRLAKHVILDCPTLHQGSRRLLRSTAPLPLPLPTLQMPTTKPRKAAASSPTVWFLLPRHRPAVLLGFISRPALAWLTALSHFPCFIVS